ncbi:hypothetical protein Afil01_40880 [Actinorhabdospora filicis]|uniref:Lipoprotein n=1 Tax=Actinorhabdospora filicis TaxID=1785913 RepID=A0A9W6WB74_9ACTN|nr:hypothetical protein [Actinorhabdospora filicis]GLZ79281.1 hypothetical protein Afil01_40880 [Actinorhabdospora filicis]
MRTGITGLAVLSVVLLSACARPADAPGGEPSPASRADFDARAAQVAAAWQRLPADGAWYTGFVPLAPLTQKPKGVDEATNAALNAGWFKLDAELREGPRDGEVTFPEGDPLKVGLITAEAAFGEVAPADPPECPAPVPDSSSGSGPDGSTSHTLPCTTLTITAATFGTTRVLTSRGMAEAPAWLFTVAGLDAPVAQVAVAPADVQDPPRADVGPADLPGYVDAVSVDAVEGTSVTFMLITGSCDTDVTPVVAETPSAVVVAGTVRRESEMCDDMAHYTPVTATLAAPLGTRPLVSARTGEALGRSPF